MENQATPPMAMPSASPPPQAAAPMAPSAPAYQAQGNYSQTPAYQVQGTAAMAPQYYSQPQQMGQVLQFPSQSQPQPQGWQSPQPPDTALQVIQQQQGLLGQAFDRLTSLIPSQRQEVQYAAPMTPPAAYPPSQVQVSQASPQTYNPAPAYSNNSSPASSLLLSQLQTSAGVAAVAGVSDADLDAIGVSKSALHAYAADLEQQKQDMYEIILKADAVAQDAVAMYDLFKNPDRAMDLSICAMDALLSMPGGFDALTSVYLPVVTQLNANASNASPQQQGGMMMPQQQQLPPMMQPPQQFAPQPRSFSWGDPLASRQAFPEMPQQAPIQSTPTLEQIPPHERFKAIDSGVFF